MVQDPPMQIDPAFKLSARIDGLFKTGATGSFATTPVDSLALGFDGIAGDRHGGLTRRSGGREPWYPRGTEIRNERQVSLVCPDNLETIAVSMDVPVIKPEWIGANLLIGGIRDFTMLPPRTTMFFEGGVTIRIDGLNVPCRLSGRAIAAHYPEQEGLDLAFVKAARYRRGLVGWVERPGIVTIGETVKVNVPEQWIYENGPRN
jgi:hypothetical protein